MIVPFLDGLRLCAVLCLTALFVRILHERVRTVLPETDAALVHCTVFLLFYFLITVFFYLTAPFGIFRVLPALAFFLVVSILLWVRDSVPEFSLGLSLPRNPFSKVCAFWAGVLFLVTSCRAYLMIPLSHDALTYHASKAALWAQSGSLWLMDGPGGWAEFRLRLPGSEIIRSFFVVLVGSDALLPAIDIVDWLAIGAVALGICKVLKLRSVEQLYGILWVLFLPVLQSLIGSSYTEPYLSFLCGVSFLLFHEFKKTQSLGILFLFSIALSLILGAKITALPLVIVALIGGTYICKTLAHGLILLFTTTLLGLPGFLLIFIETGRFFTFPIRVGELELGRALPIRQWYLNHFMPSGDDVFFVEFASLLNIFGSPFSFYPTFTVLCVFLPVLFFLRKKKKNYDAGILASAFFIFFVVFILYFHPGLRAVKMQSPFDMSRFLLHGAVIVIPIFFISLERSKQHVLIALGTFIWLGTATVRLFRGWGPHEYLPVIILSLSLGVMCLILFRARALREHYGVLLLVITFLSMSKAVHSQTRHQYLLYSYSHTFVERPWAPAVFALDEAGRKHRIAITAGAKPSIDNFLPFHFLGSRLQNKLLYASPRVDGLPFRFDEHESEQDLSKNLWQSRLIESNANYVVALPPDSVEYRWMKESHRQFQPLIEGEDWGVFEFRNDG